MIFVDFSQYIYFLRSDYLSDLRLTSVFHSLPVKESLNIPGDFPSFKLYLC